MAESILLRGFTVTAEPVSLPRLWATILKPLNHLPICAFLPTVSFGHAISWTMTETPNVGKPPRIKWRVNSITNRKSITATGGLQRGDQQQVSRAQLITNSSSGGLSWTRSRNGRRKARLTRKLAFQKNATFSAMNITPTMIA